MTRSNLPFWSLLKVWETRGPERCFLVMKNPKTSETWRLPPGFPRVAHHEVSPPFMKLSAR